MKNRRIRYSIALALNIASIALVFCSLCFVTADSMNMIFVAKTIKWYSNNFLSQYTYLLTFGLGTYSLVSIPFYIIGLKKEDFKMPNWLIVLKYIISVNTILLPIVSFAAIFPLMSMNNISFGEAFLSAFGNEHIYMHLILPIICSILFFLTDDQFEESTSMKWFAIIPLFAYSVIYVVNVFGFKIWEDTYHVIDLFNKFGIGVALLLGLAIIVVTFFIGWIYEAYNNKIKIKEFFK